jgi:hypothetical protein
MHGNPAQRSRPLQCTRSAIARAAYACLLSVMMIDAAVASDSAACNGDLGQMQADRRDIAARSTDVAAAIEQFESCTRQLSSGTAATDPCRSEADAYQKAVVRLNSVLDAADARMRRVAVACMPAAAKSPPVEAAPAPRPTPEPLSMPAAVPPAQAAPPATPAASAAPARPPQVPPPGTNAQCDLARSYKRKIPFEGVMRICERSMSEADCRVCLGPEDN